jgi:hypothetical protein
VDADVVAQGEGALLSALPVGAEGISGVHSTGIYAWWGVRELPWPAGFPPVGGASPLYIGIAKHEVLDQRIEKHHLARTRGSALRRSLVAVLSAALGLGPHVIVSDESVSSKFGLDTHGEQILTAWMLRHLRLTWVECLEPRAVESAVLRHLHPPLNDTDATGTVYRAPMRDLRKRVARQGISNGRQRADRQTARSLACDSVTTQPQDSENCARCNTEKTVSGSCFCD